MFEKNVEVSVQKKRRGKKRSGIRYLETEKVAVSGIRYLNAEKGSGIRYQVSES